MKKRVNAILVILIAIICILIVSLLSLNSNLKEMREKESSIKGLEECVIRVAKEAVDEEICEVIDKSSYIKYGWCYGEVAKIKDNISICYELSENIYVDMCRNANVRH